ncbi:MAG TPA: hypothetical protein VH158_03365 [Gemmatimonadales bacterium]|nr:hypothetical protein [Gemmatimonadales bacterium]
MRARRPSGRAAGTRARALGDRCGAGAAVLLTLLGCAACDPTSRPGDSLGRQTLARWEWHGRLVVQPDSQVTLVRMTIDTTHGGGDVGLAHYDFTPASAEGGEYEIALGLDLSQLRALRQNVPYALGPPPATIPAFATVTCFCRPLKPDSVRGTFSLTTRGLRQIVGRIDATLYFTEWTGPARPVTYSLHQRIDLVK